MSSAPRGACRNKHGGPVISRSRHVFGYQTLFYPRCLSRKFPGNVSFISVCVCVYIHITKTRTSRFLGASDISSSRMICYSQAENIKRGIKVEQRRKRAPQSERKEDPSHGAGPCNLARSLPLSGRPRVTEHERVNTLHAYDGAASLTDVLYPSFVAVFVSSSRRRARLSILHDSTPAPCRGTGA